MYYQLLLLLNINFLLIKNTLLDMTINNPLFIFSVITVIWFTPGIIVKRVNKIKQTKKMKQNQEDAIKKLYPKKKES